MFYFVDIAIFSPTLSPLMLLVGHRKGIWPVACNKSCSKNSYKMIDWFIDWLIDWLIDLLKFLFGGPGLTWSGSENIDQLNENRELYVAVLCWVNIACSW